MAIDKLPGFKPTDLVTLNNILEGVDRRLSRIDNTVPTAEADETKFSHKLPIVIGGVTYYIMMTDS